MRASYNLFLDNQSTISQIKNPDTKRRSRHIDISFHYVRQQYQENTFSIQYIAGDRHPADIMTKALNGPKMLEGRQLLNLEKSDTKEKLRSPPKVRIGNTASTCFDWSTSSINRSKRGIHLHRS